VIQMKIIAVVLIAIATVGAIGITVGRIIQSVQGFCPGDLGHDGDEFGHRIFR